jgi:hypothetical protein
LASLRRRRDTPSYNLWKNLGLCAADERHVPPTGVKKILLRHRKENIMKSFFKKILIYSISSFFVFTFIGCENEGPAENAGKQIDQAVDSAKKSIEEATE